MFQSGDRIEWGSANNRADVLQVTKDGRRLRISMWSNDAMPRRLIMWIYADQARLIRRAA